MPATEFGTMAAREFFLYQSNLYQSKSGRGGVQYAKLAGFPLE